MGAPEDEHIFGVQLRESADDGSDFPNADADYRKLFLGEDGQLHLKDSAGAVTDVGTSIADILDLPTAEMDTDLVLAPDGAGGVEFRAEAGGGGGGGALVLLEQHTASSSATLDFTSFISADYDEYVFELINMVPATNDVYLYMRMGTGAGPTWDSGNNYGYNVFATRVAATGNGGGEGGVAFINLTFPGGATVGINNTASRGGYQGSVRLFDPQSTSTHKAVVGHGRYYDVEPFRQQTMLSGVYESTTAVTGVRFLMSSGNIASGTVRVYGIAKTASAGAGGGLTLLEQHTASSSASLDFTGCISSTYDDYLVEFVHIIPATNATSFVMQVGTGGGPTYDTGSNYLGGGARFAPAGNALNQNCGGTSVILDANGGLGNAASGGGLSGTLKLYNRNPGTIKPSGVGDTDVFDGSTIVRNVFGWQYTQTTAITALRFLCGSGNIASGIIRVYGLQK